MHYAYCIIEIGPTDNETVCSTWNDFQMSLEVIGNVILQRLESGLRLFFSDKIFEMTLKFGHGHLRWHNSIGHISLSISAWSVVTMCLYCIVSEILRVEYWQPLKSVCYCTYNYLRPYSRCLMLDNIVTLKFRLEVTHPANTCTVSTSLKSTDLRAIFLLLIVRVHLRSLLQSEVRNIVLQSCKVIQDHRNWYQSKSRMQLPISLSLQ